MVVVCSKCGLENPDNSLYCNRCASALKDSQDGALKSYSDRFANNDYERIATDRVMSKWWIVVALFAVVPYFADEVIAITQYINYAVSSYPYTLDLGWYSNFVYYVWPASEVLFGILFALLVVRLVGRLNDHIRRENKFTQDFVEYIRAKSTPEQKSMMTDELMLASASSGSASRFDGSANGRRFGLWAAILIIIFAVSEFTSYQLLSRLDFSFEHYGLRIAINGLMYLSIGMVRLVILALVLFTAVYLMQTLTVHQRRWDAFVGSTYKLMAMMGKEQQHPRWPKTTPDRSVLKYVLLTIVTLGLFSLYWLYVLIDDPNRHFRDHAATEERMLAAIRAH